MNTNLFHNKGFQEHGESFYSWVVKFGPPAEGKPKVDPIRQREEAIYHVKPEVEPTCEQSKTAKVL